MTAGSDRPFIVAGGGIGGLAAALGLAQKGIDVVVLEKAPALGEIGAGIQLGPNAFHAFDYLGVGDRARDMAVYIDQLRLMDAISGEEITHIALNEPFRERFGNSYAVVHRGDLHGVFLEACRDNGHVELRSNCEALGYEQDGATVTVRVASGETVIGSALIGADGLWSNIRKQVVGDGPPRVSGHTTYRSVIPISQMPEDLRWNAATLWAGPKCHVVHSLTGSFSTSSYLPQRCAGTCSRTARRRGGGAERLPAHPPTGTEHHSAWFELENVGVVRP